MSKSKNSYTMNQSEPFRLSRTGIEDYIKCPRCTVLARREGIKPPSSPTFTLNNAVDNLFKNEFDNYRETQKPHPLYLEYGLNVVPLKHPMMNEWQNQRKGITYHHVPTNFIVFGGVDDVWIAPDGTLTIADYKATSKDGEIITIDDVSWALGYQRQLSIYAWLFRQNGFKVNSTAYLVYANGIKNRQAFNNNLEFKTTLVACQVDDSFVEPTLQQMKRDFDASALPAASPDCEMCKFFEERKTLS